MRQGGIDRCIGYYEPDATSHAALDEDTAVQQDVRNAAKSLIPKCYWCLCASVGREHVTSRATHAQSAIDALHNHRHRPAHGLSSTEKKPDRRASAESQAVGPVLPDRPGMRERRCDIISACHTTQFAITSSACSIGKRRTSDSTKLSTASRQISAARVRRGSTIPPGSSSSTYGWRRTTSSTSA